jgi:Tol biopolymer transport system component
VAIQVADADGTNRRVVTRRFAADSLTPIWSPDSRKIAFEVYDDGCHWLYVVSADRGPLRSLSKRQGCAYDQDMAWSPDGKRIVFTSLGRLVVIDADGGHRRLLTSW